ncbi:hypothetical protein AZE42_13792 [Rhizopogon vesiculosus]|uniref:Uncharacterized protein n=1 Tax=Rhizopogon vesiculosus TaxID=180088 RepID=A0A1J8QNC5_9AGAM|nr:hypothetical protein AZE42_13792 [Rhizopogon vesiculosus]
MESTNKSKDVMLGIIENLGFDFGGGEIQLQVQVIEKAPFEILLGRLFYVHTSSVTRDTINGDQNIMLSDPNMGKEITITTRNWLKAGFLTIDDPLMWGDDSNICTLTHRCLFTATSSSSYTFSDEQSIAIAPTTLLPIKVFT